MGRIKLYKCSVCGTVHTGTSANRHWKENKHEIIDLSDEEYYAQFVAEPSFEKTDKGIEGDPMYLTKKAIYIGKSGKEVSTRRSGSRVEIQYGYNNPITSEHMVLSTIDFYQILFKKKDIDPVRLHTCSSQTDDGIASYINIRSKLAKLQPENCFVVALYYNEELLLCPFPANQPFERYLDYPLKAFAGTLRHRSIRLETAAELIRLEGIRQNVETHYDLLTPRNNVNSVILATSVLTLREKKEAVFKFLLFEVTRGEYSWIEQSGEKGCADITAKAREVLIQ